MFAFLGENGAGKSTTINILCSILAKDGGQVTVGGFDLDRDADKIKRSGSYMPISIFPTAVQYVTNIVPGSYSAGLFRNVFMRGALEELAAGAPAGVVEELKQTFSFHLNFFGVEIGTGWMYAILAFSFFLFLAVHLVVKHFAGRQK